MEEAAHSMKKKSNWPLIILLAPATLIMSVVFLVPFVQLLVYSFWSFVPGSFIPDTHFSLGNYRELITDPYYFKIYLRTLRISLISTGVTLALSYPLARYISRQPVGKKGFLLALVMLPMIGGAMIQTLGWMALLMRYGIINGTLRSLGILKDSIPFLGTELGVIIGLIQSFIPLLVLPLVASLGAIDESMEEAAKSLGASSIRTFFEVVFPLSLPGAIAGTILVMMANLTMFVTPSMLGQGKVQVFGTLAYQQAVLVMNWPFSSAFALFFIFMAAIVAFAARLLSLSIQKIKAVG